MKEVKQLEKEMEILVNGFILTWIPNHYAHLMDNDENDGETLRNNLKEIFKEGIKIGESEVINAYDKGGNWGLHYGEQRKEEVNNILLNVILQTLGDRNGVIDNKCMSDYEDACNYLAKEGLIIKVNDRMFKEKYEAKE